MASSAFSRRHALVFAATGLALAGCAPTPTPTPTPSATRSPPTPTSSAGPPNWAALSAAVTGTLFRPGNRGYDTARLVENPRFDAARPIAVLSVATAADVAAAVAFCVRFAVPLALRAGGHSYVGYSAGGAPGTRVPASLVIDTRALDTVVVGGDDVVRIGAGASLAQVYSALGAAGRAISSGSCATVGAAGLILGGGVGVLVRAWGLSCDALTAVEIVTADGRARVVDAVNDPDLFWACQGGGGGQLGIVTALRLSTHPAPVLSTFSLRFLFADAAAVIDAWQRWAPGADPRLWSTLKLLGGGRHPDGPGVYLSGTWLGQHADLAAQLAPFLADAGVAPTSRSSVTTDYLAAMLGYAGCATTPLAACQTGAGGALTRESFAATSHVPTTVLPAEGISALVAEVSRTTRLAGLLEGGVSLDALGGEVSSVASAASAFPHREALMTVQYTATFEDAASPEPFDTFVRGFRRALVPFWGDSAYVNYADDSLTSPSTSYFAGNATRLQRVKKKFDPFTLFTQPQSF